MTLVGSTFAAAVNGTGQFLSAGVRPSPDGFSALLQLSAVADSAATANPVAGDARMRSAAASSPADPARTPNPDGSHVDDRPAMHRGRSGAGGASPVRRETPSGATGQVIAPTLELRRTAVRAAGVRPVYGLAAPLHRFAAQMAILYPQMKVTITERQGSCTVYLFVPGEIDGPRVRKLVENLLDDHGLTLGSLWLNGYEIFGGPLSLVGN